MVTVVVSGNIVTIALHIVRGPVELHGNQQMFLLIFSSSALAVSCALLIYVVKNLLEVLLWSSHTGDLLPVPATGEGNTCCMFPTNSVTPQ